MLILPFKTPLLHRGSDLAAALRMSTTFQGGDIIVISSKAIATTEGATVPLASVTPSAEAEKLSEQCHQDPRFTECILRETARMNGVIAGVSPYALLTSLRPTGMKSGRILCANAGVDLSNTDEGHAIGWPHDPVTSARTLREKLGVPVIISDSYCMPGREGVIAIALVCAGIDPLRSEVGQPDLFGKTMRMTHEAVADQLAIAANAVMGNVAQSVPAAVIRDAGVPSSEFVGWIEGMRHEDDLYRDVMKV